MLADLIQNLPAIVFFGVTLALILYNFRIGRRKRRRSWLYVEGERKPPKNKKRRFRPRDEL